MTDGGIESWARIDGRDPEDIFRLGIVQVMEGAQCPESLTVEDNLDRRTPTRGATPRREADMAMIYALFPTLVERRRSSRGI